MQSSAVDRFFAKCFEDTIFSFKTKLVLLLHRTQSFYKISIIIRRMELNQFPFCPHVFSNFLCHVGFTRSRCAGKNKIMISDQQLFDFVKFHIVQDFLTPFYT